jgi:hypothetical protein
MKVLEKGVFKGNWIWNKKAKVLLPKGGRKKT